MEIRYSPKAFERFKRVARSRYPVEYLEALFGHVRDGEIEIVKSLPVRHSVSIDADGLPGCEFEDAGLEIVKLKTEKDGLTFVGSIHSHPDSACTPSEGDNQSVIDDGELVFGIYAFTKNGSRCTGGKLQFFLPQLPVKPKHT